MMRMFGFCDCCACTLAGANKGVASAIATNACFHLAMWLFHFSWMCRVPAAGSKVIAVPGRDSEPGRRSGVSVRLLPAIAPRYAGASGQRLIELKGKVGCGASQKEGCSTLRE